MRGDLVVFAFRTDDNYNDGIVRFLPPESTMSLGDLEQVALLALARIRDEAYGAALAQEIEERTGRSVSPGALYTVMDRLQDKGFVESWIGDSTPDRGGRRRKIYQLTPEGARELRHWYHGIQKMASGVMPSIDELAQEQG